MNAVQKKFNLKPEKTPKHAPMEDKKKIKRIFVEPPNKSRNSQETPENLHCYPQDKKTHRVCGASMFLFCLKEKIFADRIREIVYLLSSIS